MLAPHGPNLLMPGPRLRRGGRGQVLANTRVEMADGQDPFVHLREGFPGDSVRPWVGACA